MPRTVPLIAGLVVVSAVTYKFRDDLLKDTGDLQSRLQSARSKLDHITSSTSTHQLANHPMESVLPDISPVQDSKKYINDRLMPSGKLHHQT
ncbi:hypothetical protein DM01DRAFT_1100194 [Hesseltinella vesiculosa]|uniref:Uncharacterized protein n=1 Tax=Hesseltinella vesiculosa TaxID=101127 RepID=A0A1X2GC22_9FUNG|nr:hypothetical protein DM01DRAFT_1100194 [Hesseltinella vesiculosa]